MNFASPRLACTLLATAIEKRLGSCCALLSPSSDWMPSSLEQANQRRRRMTAEPDWPETG